MKKITLLFVLTIISFAAVDAQNTKADIDKAYKTLYMRGPDAWESIPQNYNNGKWNNYNELVQYVIQFKNSITAANITFKFSQATYNNNTKVVGIYQNGVQIAADLVAAGGGNLVAAGGGNLVAAGGGNLVAAGGGNLVAAGGGNIVVNMQTKGASFGGAYTLASTGTKVVKTSGSGAFIIK